MPVTRGEIAGLSYREALPDGEASGPPVLLLHGFPETSRLWVPVMERVAAAGRRALAPDLYDLGTAAPRPPATWERTIEDVERFRQALGLDALVLVTHDWGGMAGLAWACDHPDAVRGLVIASTGFFADGKWHGMAKSLRTPGEGEEVLGNLTAEAMTAVLRQLSPRMEDDALDEYVTAFTRRPELALEFYRSMDMEKFEPYEGRLAALGVPTLIVWGEDDAFAPVAGARRFEREIPGSRLEVLPGAGHFVVDDEPERVAELVADFAGGVG